MSGQSRVTSPSTTLSTSAAALAELIGRLTIEEKRKLAKVVDWDEFQRLRKSERRISDPKVYVGTTENGLSAALRKFAPDFCSTVILSRSAAEAKNLVHRLAETRFFGLRPQNDTPDTRCELTEHCTKPGVTGGVCSPLHPNFAG